MDVEDALAAASSTLCIAALVLREKKAALVLSGGSLARARAGVKARLRNARIVATAMPRSARRSFGEIRAGGGAAGSAPDG